MRVEFGDDLKADNSLFQQAEACSPILEDVFGGFRTANALLEKKRDYKGRDIIRLIVKDHGRTVQTAFAPDEVSPGAHFRDRCYQFAGQIATLEQSRECPNCGIKYHNEPIPFRCRVCSFQIVQECPNCHNEVSISEYSVQTSTLWQCPHCQARLHAAYADPMFDTTGYFVQPLVELRVATEA